MSGLFPGFDRSYLSTGDARIHFRIGGDGPPLLLLHGYPQTHCCWHRVAGPLARHFRVVMPDLRGYGDSEGPPPGPNGEGYTFSDMAGDQLALMLSLGYQHFLVVGHDRGGRVAHRLALDHSENVERVVLLDILPTFHVWNAPSREWTIRSWHWSFMAQTGGLAERMITTIPASEFLPAIMARPPKGLSVFDAEAYAEYIRCFTPSMVRASCADYRACATIGFVRDAADRDRRVEVPVLVAWGTRSHVAMANPGPLAVWRDYCRDVRGAAVDAGHFVQEEASEEVLALLLGFLRGQMR